MSIHQGRKKKIVNTMDEQEEIAKDRLFEISYFDEQKLRDQSHFLIQNQYDPNNAEQKIKERPINFKYRFQKKKSQSLGLHKSKILLTEMFNEDNHTLRNSKKTKYATLNDSDSIQNAIESSQVFIGNKKYFQKSARTQFQQNTSIRKNRKKNQTMPIIKQRSFLQLTQNQRISANKFQLQLQNPLLKNLRNEKWKLQGLLTHKNAQRQNIIQLKFKLKRDLFLGIEQKLSKKYNFFL